MRLLFSSVTAGLSFPSPSLHLGKRIIITIPTLHGSVSFSGRKNQPKGRVYLGCLRGLVHGCLSPLLGVCSTEHPPFSCLPLGSKESKGKDRKRLDTKYNPLGYVPKALQIVPLPKRLLLNSASNCEAFYKLTH